MANRNGLSRAILIYPLAGFAAARDGWAAALGITDFETLEPPGFGIRVAISWATGLELIAPLDEPGGFPEQVRRILAERGEGLFGLVWEVTDLAAAEERARAAGPAVGARRIDCLASHPDWRERFSLALESSLGEIHGVRVTLIQLEPAPRLP